MTDRRRALAKELFEHLNSGKIQVNPEGKLPSERDMAAALGVTRPLLRQAIAVLEAFGLLEIRDRQGIFMSRHELPELIFSGDWPPSMMLEIFQVRMMIEPEAARIVAENRTPEDLRKIGESVAQMGAIIESGREDMESLLSKWNRIFHAQIMAATGNQFLCRIYETVSRAYETASTSLIFRREELRFDEIFSEHRHILDAIREKNGERAAKLVLHHIQASVERASESLVSSGFKI